MNNGDALGVDDRIGGETRVNLLATEGENEKTLERQRANIIERTFKFFIADNERTQHRENKRKLVEGGCEWVFVR